MRVLPLRGSILLKSKLVGTHLISECQTAYITYQILIQLIHKKQPLLKMNKGVQEILFLIIEHKSSWFKIKDDPTLSTPFSKLLEFGSFNMDMSKSEPTLINRST